MDARFGASVWKMGYFGKSSAISVMVVSSYCLHFMQKVGVQVRDSLLLLGYAFQKSHYFCVCSLSIDPVRRPQYALVLGVVFVRSLVSLTFNFAAKIHRGVGSPSYPTKLCAAVAKCLREAEVSRIASHVNHVLTR